MSELKIPTIGSRSSRLVLPSFAPSGKQSIKDEKDLYKFIFPRENKEIVTSRLIVTHPTYGLDRIRGETKLLNPNQWSFTEKDEIKSSTVELYIDWITAKLKNENDLTDTTISIEDGLIINYLSSTDYDFLRRISSNADRKIQYTEILKKLCPLVHFIAYMGNRVLWNESDGLLRYIMKILLFGEVNEKFEIAGIGKNMIPDKTEESSMKNWIAVHGNPTNSQLIESKDFSYWNRLKNNIPVSSFSPISLPKSPSSLILPSFSSISLTASQRSEMINSLRQKRIERNFNNERGIHLSITGKRSAGIFSVSIRDAFISTTIKNALTPMIADDTKTWNLSALSIPEIENKFNTTPFAETEISLEVSSFKSLEFIVTYMKHFHGDDTSVSIGPWEIVFLHDVQENKILDSLFNDAKYLAIKSLTDLIAKYKQLSS